MFAWLIHLLSSLFKSIAQPSRLLPALILGATWFILPLLPQLDIRLPRADLLNWATFSLGGLSTEPGKIIGGVLGKSIFAGTLVSLFARRPRTSAADLAGPATSRVTSKNTSDQGRLSGPAAIASFLLGTGLALALTNFLTGDNQAPTSVIGLVAALGTARAMRNDNSYLHRLMTALTTALNPGKSTSRAASLSRPSPRALATGTMTGFFLSTPLALLTEAAPQQNYLIGLILAATGLVLNFAKNGQAGKKAAAIMLLALTVLSPLSPLSLISPAAAPRHDPAPGHPAVSGLTAATLPQLLADLSPEAAAETTYSSTCAYCGSVNTFTEYEVKNVVLYCNNCGRLTGVDQTGSTTPTTQATWRFLDAQIYRTPLESNGDENPADDALRHTIDYEEGRATFTSTGIDAYGPYGDGNFISGQIAWSSAPYRDLTPGETVTIQLDASIIGSQSELFEEICFGQVMFILQSGSYSSESYASANGLIPMPSYDAGATAIASRDPAKPASATVWGTVPSQGSDGDRLTIRVLATGTGVNYDQVYMDYTYEYDADGSLVGSASPADSPDPVEPPNEDPTPIGPQIVDQNAGETTGDSAPVPMKTAVVIGVASTLAAAAAAAGSTPAGAAAAATTSGRSPVNRPGSRKAGAQTDARKKEEEELQKTGQFRMIVHKTFGSTIVPGHTSQAIFARIEKKQPDGGWLHDPGRDNLLSIQLATAVPGLTLEPTPGGAKGPGVKLRLDNDNPPATCVIACKYQGPDTYFQNNLTFKLAGQPKITIPDPINILGTATEPCETIFQVSGFATRPELSVTCKTDLLDLSLGTNKAGQDILIIHATEKANQLKFQRFIHRFPCILTAETAPHDAAAGSAMSAQATASATAAGASPKIEQKFTVQLCYEGIGTAYTDLKNHQCRDKVLLQSFTDAESDKRAENAYILPLAVLRWDGQKRELAPDPTAAANLQLSFKPDPKAKNLKPADARQAIDDAAIKVQPVAASRSKEKVDQPKKPAVFHLYPEKSATAVVPEVPLLVSISEDSGEYPPLELPGLLKAQTDYRALLKWFIEYGQGTFVDRYIKIGDVDTYFGALDFIGNRVCCESNMPYSPKTKQNHYEDGKYDVSRPNYVYLQDASMPHQIGDFEQIQSLHHELCHAIEHQHGDTSGNEALAERHSYFIQNLTNLVKTLADLERGKIDPALAAREAIKQAYSVFFDPHNTEPQTFSWFGVSFLTQHKLFERYADFEIYAGSTVPDTLKSAISRAFRENYFPGNLEAKRNYGATFAEISGPFAGGTWQFKASESYPGLITDFGFTHPDYTFRQTAPAIWEPGTLKLTVAYEVKSEKTGQIDELKVELDGGPFNKEDYHYPVIREFTNTWRSTYRLIDGILGQPAVTSKAVKK